MLTHGGFELNFRAAVREFWTGLGANQSAAEYEHSLDYIKRYEAGNGRYRVDRIWSQYYPALESTDLDLLGGLVNLANQGETVTFPKVMGIFIRNWSQTSGEYIAVGGGSNPWITHLGASGDIEHVGPDGFKALWSPLDAYATVAGTGDILRINPGAGNPACSILIVGRSA